MSDTQVIDFSAQAGAGLENVSNEDLQVPFLQIIQTNSPEVDKAASDYESKGIEGASAGDVFDTVSRKVIADFGEPVRVIPIAYNKAYVEWVPREQGGGIVTVHKDPGILTQTTKNEKNKDVLESGNIVETTAYHHVMYESNDEWINAILSMQATQLKKSRAWLSKITSIKLTQEDGTIYTPPMFSHTYDLSSVTESNKYGSWFGWKVEINSALSDPNAYNLALAVREKTQLALESEPF
jgi:hypothetical protein